MPNIKIGLGEKYVAMFDYNGQYEDEISFKVNLRSLQL